MRIDAHNHFWKFDPVRDAWIDESMGVIRRDFLPEEFASVLKQNGIDGTVAVQADQSEEETMFLLGLANKNDCIKGVVGWIDLQAPDIDQRLDHFDQYKLLKGFRHIAQAEKNDFLVSERFMNGIKALSLSRFTYDLLVFPPQLPAAVELVKRFPDQAFVLDHIAKPYVKKREINVWAKNIQELAANDNVWCKISGLVTEADWNVWKTEDFYPYLDVITSAFGTDRLMFGSDWPVCLLAAEYSQVLKIVEDYYRTFSEAERSKIFGGNAKAFYDL